MTAQKFIISTTNTLQGYKILDYLAVETAEVVTGTGPISEMFSKIADTMGVRSKAFETKLDKGRKQAFEILKTKAEKIGANAMIGLDIDLMAYEKNRTGIMVTATLVVAEKKIPVHRKKAQHTRDTIVYPKDIIKEKIEEKTEDDFSSKKKAAEFELKYGHLKDSSEKIRNKDCNNNNDLKKNAKKSLDFTQIDVDASDAPTPARSLVASAFIQPSKED